MIDCHSLSSGFWLLTSDMHIPLLDLKAQLAPLRDEILEEIAKVVDSTTYILGPKVELLEKNIADYCGARQGVGVASGTDGLLVALMALGVGPGDLVLTTPYTFFATIGCILRLQAKPLFVDIDQETYNIDVEQMADMLADNPEVTAKIKVILPVHLYGQCADMGRIMVLANRYDIPVVEDAAQAIGAACPVLHDGKVEWRQAGSMGAAGCFSFFPSKNLGGIGDAGMIVTSDSVLADKMRILRVHGSSPKYHHEVVGGNFRIDPVQAVVLNIKLPYLAGWHEARRQNGALYDRLFMETDLVTHGKISLPVSIYRDLAEKEAVLPDYHIYNQYVVRVVDRDGLRRFLLSCDIGVEIYYPIPLHKQKCLADMGYHNLSFPEVEKAAQETLALPIYPELTNEMQHFVVEKIADFYSQ